VEKGRRAWVARCHAAVKGGWGGGAPAQHPATAAGRQRPRHAGHGWADVAAQNRGGGALTCGPWYSTGVVETNSKISNEFE
jgi:hypothetical protein